MQFQISNKQQKKSASTGKEYVSATLTDEQGVEYAGINAFNGEFNTSDVWHGELKQNGQYYNLVSPKMAAGSNFKQKVIEESMEKKNTAIRGFQESKEYSIKVASTMSGAVQLAVAQFTDKNDLRTLEELVEHYRLFLWNTWSKADQLPPF